MTATQVAVAVVGALGLIGAALVGGLFARRKSGAETSQIIGATYQGLITTQDTRLDRLEAAQAKLELDLEHERHQRRLSNQYARDLVADLRAEGMTVRPAPAGLELD